MAEIHSNISVAIASDSEEDEDYIPPSTNDNDEEEKCTSSSLNNTTELSQTFEQKAVDDAFASLFPNSDTSSNRKTQQGKYQSKREKTPVKLGKAMRKKRKILSDIFGGSHIASKIIANKASVISSLVNSRIKSESLPIYDKKIVKEIKRFAGQDIEIERKVVNVVKGSLKQSNVNISTCEHATVSIATESGIVLPAKEETKGIDSLLLKMEGPSKISTIAKTSVDWDVFKEKIGMEEDLKKKAEGKDAYLVKKDFLDRVDLRQFEQEKAQRDVKRVANSKV